MAQVTYTPPQADPAVGSALRAFEATDSIMKRGQMMRWQAEDRAREQAQFIAMQPVLAAQRRANIVNAEATIENATNVQRLRSQFGEASRAAQSEYEAAMKLPTYREQAQALSGLQQKYNWFSLIPEGKAFADTLANQRVFASQSALADQHLNNQLMVQNEITERGLEIERYQQEHLNKRAELTSNTRLQTAGMQAETSRANTAARDPLAILQRANQLADQLAQEDPELSQLMRNYATRMSEPASASAGANAEFIKTLMGGASPATPAPSPAPAAVAPKPTPVTPQPSSTTQPKPATAPSLKEALDAVKF